ncbi:MAG: hypothetical protein AAF808_17150, partial [Cyanobacteria bacterium P01_D01_bin.2]
MASNSLFRPSSPRLNKANLPSGAWLVGTYLSTHQNLAKESTFNLDKAISQKVKGSFEIIKHQKDILIKTSNQESTRALLATKTFGSKPVIFSVHHSLNFYRGIINAPEVSHLSDVDLEHIFDFKGQNVLALEKLNPNKNATQRDPRLRDHRFIVTFDTKCRDDCGQIKLGDCVYPVRPYYPLPIRCQTCQRYGHVETNCKNPTPRCGKCSAKHRTKDCTSKSLKCAACGGAHGADNPKCPTWLREKEVNVLAEDKKLPFDLARKQVLQKEKSRTVPKSCGSKATTAAPSTAGQEHPISKQPQPPKNTSRHIRPLMEPLFLAPIRPSVPLPPPRGADTFWRRWTPVAGWEDLPTRTSSPPGLPTENPPAPQAPKITRKTWTPADRGQ